MVTQKKIILGYDAEYFKTLANASDVQILELLARGLHTHARILLALIQYLQQYFDECDVIRTFERNFISTNGTFGGLVKKINYSEMDVGVPPVYMNKYTCERVDFSYPYRLEDYMFITRKPTYKPHIFGIFRIFSLPVWIAIILVLIAMPIISYAILSRKYTFRNISFDIFAVLMKQNTAIRPSSLVEKLLIYSWVVGAMILCLSHDSVLLSFLSIPPVTKIKTLSDLALAVENGDYHCIAEVRRGFADYWMGSNHEHLKIIGTDILKNKLSYGAKSTFMNFARESQTQNLAYFIESKFADLLAGKFFLSEDRFHESMPAMMVRRGFRHKKLLDSFVHKMMASGLCSKYFSDHDFTASRWLNTILPDYETDNRKLTLTDLAPAFIFLLSGYFISILVLIFEIASSPKKTNSMKINRKRKQRKAYDETPV